MRSGLDLYRRLVAAQLRSQMAYRASFLVDALGTVAVTGLEFAALALVFGRFDGLGGWDLPEVAVLFGLVTLAFGLADLLFSGFDPRRFGEEVRRGLLDQKLLRPAPVALQVLAADAPLHRIGKVAVGGAILLVGLEGSDIAWTASRALLLPLAGLGIVLFFGGVFVAGAAVTFWTIEAVEAVNVLSYGTETLISYPMHIYDAWLRRVFTFLVPALFLAYEPVLAVLGRPDPLGLPLWSRHLSPLAGAAALAAALALWRAGLRRYASTGH